MNATYQVVPEKVIGYLLTDKRWDVVTLPGSNFGQFMQNYHVLEVAVLDVMGTELTFYPYKHADELLSFSGSLQDWFNTKAGVAIPTLKPGHPELEFSTSHYQPLAITAEANISLAPPNTHPSHDFAIDDARDVVIQVDDSKIERYNSGLLYSVDGLWVRDLAESYGIRLMGAGDIIRHGGGGNVSALVMNDIGKVTTYDINKDVVFKVDTDQSYYTSLTIKTPVSITGKTVGFVFAGKLHWIELERYYSDTSVGITFTNEDIITHLMETSDRFDWDVLGLGDFGAPSHVTRIRSDGTMEKLFDHISTFLVVIDNDYIERIYTPIATQGATGRWHVTDVEAKLTLGHIVNQTGNLVDYWPRWDAGIWTFYTKQYDYTRPLLKHAKWKKQSIVNDAIAIHDQPYVDPMLTMCNLRARRKGTYTVEPWSRPVVAQSAAPVRVGPTATMVGSNLTRSADYKFWGNGCVVSNKVYFAPYHHPRLVEYDPNTNMCVEYEHPEYLFNGHNAISAVAVGSKIVIAPYAATSIMIFDTETKQFTKGPEVNPSKSHCWAGSVLADNGLVYITPGNKQPILEYNIETNAVRQIPIFDDWAGQGGMGAILADNGKIYMTPRCNDFVAVYDPETDTLSKIEVPDGRFKWANGCYLNGKIYCGTDVEGFNDRALVIDTKTDTISFIRGIPAGAIGCGELNGKIYWLCDDGKVYIYDTLSKTVTNIDSPSLGSSGAVSTPYAIYGTPRMNDDAGILEVRP